VVLFVSYNFLGENNFCSSKVQWSDYAYNVQLVCDDKKLIRYYVVGWPGSCGDSLVFSRSFLYNNVEDFFSYLEYIIADAGYGLTRYVCTPFKQPEASYPENEQFNYFYSVGRVLIEHCNGMMKSRWNSLTGLRVAIHNNDDFLKVNKWIICCIIFFFIPVA
jgi:hypothetical protein